MNRETTPDNPYDLQSAHIEWRQGDIPVARGFDDIYFAGDQGLDESRYVFLGNNQLAERWQPSSTHWAQGEDCFTIGETGFGTGLNFLASWELWRQHAPAHARLHFISTEKFPLTRDDLARSLGAWPQLATLAGQLVERYPVLVPGHHCLPFDDGRVTLHLLLGDAIDSLQDLCASHRPELALPMAWQVDAWFLDGFAPAKNPGLWNDALYRVIARLSAAGTTLATFTAVGEVRRGLQRCGFEMQKTAGFGQKRDMLKGVFRQRPTIGTSPTTEVQAPWYHHAPPVTAGWPRHVAVVGAGLAGTHTARALAERGLQVSLIDARNTIAAEASGNPAGMLYTKLSPQAGTLNQFTLSSYLFALRFYQQLQQRTGIPLVDACGVLQLAHTDKDLALLDRLQSCFASHDDLVRFVDSEQASALAGLALAHPGWFYPAAGWVSPPVLCRALAEHANIELHLGADVIELAPTGNAGWRLITGNQTASLEADAVVIASSHHARRLQQCQWLPLKIIRGQISQIPANNQSGALQTVICHEGYLTPAIAGQHLCGATFDINDSDTALREADHRRNLDSLHDAIPDLFATADTAGLAGRAALRCASPDYLPIAGPLPDYRDFIETYAPLRKNAHTRLDLPGPYYPGLYINVAHGSRGLTSTPLCAELIAASINGEPPPLDRPLLQALNPARFIIRDLIRSKI